MPMEKSDQASRVGCNRTGQLTSCARHLGWVLAMVVVLHAASSSAAVPALCSPTVLAVDTSYADTTGEVFVVARFGRSHGQVFEAPDTLIESVTAWLLPQETSTYNLIKFFLAPVDSTGMPVPFTILYDGPINREQVASGENPIPIRFTFDPPIALPRPGKYCFALKQYTCDSAFRLRAKISNPYPDGMAWDIGNTWNCVGVGVARNEDPNLDLVFAISFCDTGTPARPKTWGELKVRYR